MICQVIDDDQMPVDENGNVADVVMDPNSTISRAIPGRYIEQYINAASRDVYKVICQQFPSVKHSEAQYNADTLREYAPDLLAQSFNYLLEYYRIVSPQMHAWFETGLIGTDYESQITYLSEVIAKGQSTNCLGIWRAPNEEKISQDTIDELEKTVYRPTYGPVSYIGNSGNQVTTKKNVRIGALYFMVLEKIGDDWAAVSSCKTQHFGVIAQLGKNDKFSKPVRQQGARGAGEAEVRIFASYISPRWVAEMMDRNNNPVTHRAMVEALLTEDNPSNVENLVDRREIKYGGNRPLMLIKHLVEVSGARFVDQPFNPREAGLQ